MKDKIINKFLSGRFIFTITAAIVFAYLAITKIMEPQDAEKIILVVVYAYFSRPRNNEPKKEGV